MDHNFGQPGSTNFTSSFPHCSCLKTLRLQSLILQKLLDLGLFVSLNIR